MSTPTLPGPDRSAPPARRTTDLVPRGVLASAVWTACFVVVGLGVYLLLRLMSVFEVLVVPVLVATLLVALLRPVVDLLTRRPGRRGLPRGLAALLTLLIALALVVGLFTLIGQQVATGFGDLRSQAVQGFTQLRQQLAAGPLHLTTDQLGNLVDQASSSLQNNSSRLVTGALQVGSTAADVGTGFVLVLFSSFFMLAGGDRIWAWVVHLFPRSAHRRVDGAGRGAWTTLTAYVRATVIVAFVDGAGVAIAAAVLGVPLALPLGVLVFLGAFIPIVGALLTGVVAVLVALVAKGLTVALLMLAAVIVVQQVEAHVLQPFLMGAAVRVHPLAVILSIGAGVLLAGIAGGLFAVPLAAVVNRVSEYLSSDQQAEEQAEDEPGPVADEPAGGELGPSPDRGDEPGPERALDRSPADSRG